jgi:hypothetical protein
MRNQLTLDALTRELQMNCGDILAACKAVGVSLIFVNQWRKDDKEVHETLIEAERVGTQGLVSAAIQRAVRGVEEDVYFKGAVVGQKTVYSDGLLQTLLKAKVPEFSKDNEGGGGVQVNVNVANLMPRAATYDEWLQMKNATAAHLEAQKSLPAPTDEVIEVEYVGVAPGHTDLMVAPEVIDAADFGEIPDNTLFAGIEL